MYIWKIYTTKEPTPVIANRSQTSYEEPDPELEALLSHIEPDPLCTCGSLISYGTDIWADKPCLVIILIYKIKSLGGYSLFIFTLNILII